MTHTNLSNLDDLRNQIQLIVKDSSSVVLHIHFSDNEHETRRLDFLVFDAAGSQHLHAATFKIVEIVRVVYTLLTIRFVISHTNLNLVWAKQG